MLESLDRLCKDLEEQARFDKDNLKNHYNSHPKNKEGGEGDDLFPPNMTEEEYDNAANILSSNKAYPLGSGKNKITGYITQNDRKIKIKLKQGSYDEFVVYVGDDVTGEVITYYIKKYPEIIQQANPFVSGNIKNKYKSDLDGKFEGLKIFNPKPNMSQKEKEDIIYKIYNNIKLS